MERVRWAVLSLGALALLAVSGVAYGATHHARTHHVRSYDLMFSAHTVVVNRGDKVTWLYRSTSGDPHTITVVKREPRSFNCAACNQALKEHGANEKTQTVKHLVVNHGRRGLDATGDSIFQPPHRSVTATISAPAGTVLRYVCAIHPWMQGTIRVR